VDEGTKKKIDKKVLRGYSVGVTPTAINRADEVEALDWVETSYVDRPKDPDAVFLYRTEGFDPDAEVEVEVLDDPATSAATERTDAVPDAPATDSPGDPPAPDSAIAPIPSHSSLADPSGEELAPAAVSDNPAAGVSSDAEGERAPIGDATRLWAMLQPDVAEETTPQERRALLAETLVGLGVAV